MVVWENEIKEYLWTWVKYCSLSVKNSSAVVPPLHLFPSCLLSLLSVTLHFVLQGLLSLFTSLVPSFFTHSLLFLPSRVSVTSLSLLILLGLRRFSLQNLQAIPFSQSVEGRYKIFCPMFISNMHFKNLAFCYISAANDLQAPLNSWWKTQAFSDLTRFPWVLTLV